MPDTIYTPSEMLDRIEARTASLRAELRELDGCIRYAQRFPESTEYVVWLREQRDRYTQEVASIFQNVI